MPGPLAVAAAIGGSSAVAAPFLYPLYGLYSRSDLGGNGDLNNIDVHALANWKANAQRDAALANGVVDYNKTPEHGKYGSLMNAAGSLWDQGDDDLSQAIELGRLIRKPAYEHEISTADAKNAYDNWARDGFLSLGDTGNLWDIYADNPEYAKFDKTKQQAYWIADYLDDLSYLQSIKGEEDARWDLFQKMATKSRNDISGEDRQNFRYMLKKIHELRLAEAAKKTAFTPIPDPKKVKQNQTNELNLPVF
jgi:hypothetical protein